MFLLLLSKVIPYKNYDKKCFIVYLFIIVCFCASDWLCIFFTCEKGINTKIYPAEGIKDRGRVEVHSNQHM